MGMKLLPLIATLSCVAMLGGCGRQTAGPSDADQQAQQRLAEQKQADQLSQLHEREAALDERERLLSQREQQLTPTAPPPVEQPIAPAPLAAPAQPAVAEPPPAVSTDASLQTFYDALSPYGSWVAMAGYGYVWQPAATLQDFRWRPYTLGHWAYTDDGWTWLSDEPFGWITYHYGRWMRTHSLGWVWVPRDEWAPAWVSWRYGNDFVGWAPLPPEAQFDGATGIQQWADQQYNLGSSDYTFVPAADFGDDSMADVEVPPDQSGAIYDESSNVTNIYYDNAAYAIICYGPSYDFMRSKSRRPFPPQLTLKRGGFRTGGNNGAVISGGALQVAAPRIIPARKPSAPAAVRGNVADGRLIAPSNPPPPHGSLLPHLYQPPQTTAGQSAPGPRAPSQQAPARVSQPTGPLSADQTAPAGGQPPAGMRFPSRMNPAPIPPDVEAQKAHDLQIIQQQQAGRDAERQQEEAQAAQAAAEQQQRAEELRVQEVSRAQRAAEEQSLQAARAQEVAAREQAVREQATRAAQPASQPSGTQPPGRGQQ
jgi:hypothetical protein